MRHIVSQKNSLAAAQRSTSGFTRLVHKPFIAAASSCKFFMQPFRLLQQTFYGCSFPPPAAGGPPGQSSFDSRRRQGPLPWPITLSIIIRLAPCLIALCGARWPLASGSGRPGPSDTVSLTMRFEVHKRFARSASDSSYCGFKPRQGLGPWI